MLCALGIIAGLFGVGGFSPAGLSSAGLSSANTASANTASANAVQSAPSTREAKKPSLSLRVTPPVGFAPLRTRLVVDVREGDNDYADFYCPTVEWDWGDGTVSANSEDCDPYEAGKSEIRRRFSTEHIFRQAGAYPRGVSSEAEGPRRRIQHGQRAGPKRLVSVLTSIRRERAAARYAAS